MEKALSIVCVALFMMALLSSCGSRRGDACPNNFGSLEQNDQHIG
jgi:hypothetical protein